MLFDLGCSFIVHSLLSQWTTSSLHFSKDNYVIAAQGYQVLHEKNDSKMTQSFCHVDLDAFDLNWHAPSRAIVWWMVCFWSCGHLKQPHQTTELKTLLCCKDGSTRKVNIWLLWRSDRLTIIVIWCYLIDNFVVCWFYTHLCLWRESQQHYKHIRASGLLLLPLGNPIQLSWHVQDMFIKNILLLAFPCLCAFSVKMLTETKMLVFSLCAEDSMLVFKKSTNYKIIPNH